MASKRSLTEARQLELDAPSSTVRWMFLAICSGLLAILLVSGVLATRFLDAIHGQELAISRALTERTRMLSSLSLEVQNYNQAVKDFVEQTKADQVKPSRQQLDQLTLEIDSGLNSYPRQRDPIEDALLGNLRDVFIQQRTLYIAVLANQPGAQDGKKLAARIEPLQTRVLDWSAKLDQWNENKLKGADEGNVRELATVQAGLARTLAISLGSGLLLVIIGMAYIIRLERQTRGRYLQLVQSRRDLQNLSESLLDAQETERRSISRELHDEVGQSLGALLVDLARLANRSADRPEMKAQLEKMHGTAEQTFQEVRNIALLLRPSMLDDLGLVAALEWQGREMSRRSEIEVEVQSEDVSTSLPDDYKVCIYRVVQEALNNAVRHSGAKNAKVNVQQGPDGITVRVSDDGQGFNPERTRGLGILGMEERVKRLAGTLTIESSPGNGATLIVKLPLIAVPAQAL